MNKLVKKALASMLCIAMLSSNLLVNAASYTEPNTPAESDNIEVISFDDGNEGFVTHGVGKLTNVASIGSTQSGDMAMKVESTELSNGGDRFNSSKTFSEQQTEKVVDVWVYDDISGDLAGTKFAITMNSGTQDTKTDEVTIMANNDGETVAANRLIYTYRFLEKPSDGTKASDVQVGSGVSRSTGWHKFTYDYRNPGEVTVMVDDIESSKYTMQLEAGLTSGFKSINVVNFWSSDPSAIYIDDITITSFPTAPTNAVLDDDANTFGWTNLEGFTQPSDYEYTTDGGATWTACSSNPQNIGDLTIALGDAQVRVRDLNKGVGEVRPGNPLINHEVFLSESEKFKVVLEELYEHSLCFYEMDYTADSWADFVVAREEVAQAINGNVTEQMYDDYVTAVNSLVMDMDKDILYSFEKGSQSENPFTLIYGSYDDSESTNQSSFEGQALKVVPELVDGKYLAELKYTFPQPIEDKMFEMFLRDYRYPTDITEIEFYNSQTNNGIVMHSKINPTGSGEVYYESYTIENGIKTVNVNAGYPIRNDWHKWEFNFTNYESAQLFHNNTLLIEELEGMTSFDTVTFRMEGQSDDDLTVDEFVLRDKNAVTKVELPDETASIGYFDTYEVSRTNNTITVEDDSYPTTDKFTYSSSNEDVLFMTTLGSGEAFDLGTATATVTSSSGATDSVEVTVEDRKVTGIKLSNTDIVDINDNNNINYVKEISLLPNTMEVINAVLEPEGVTVREVIWESSNPIVASVEDGLITTGSTLGNATITATTKDGGHVATLDVKVAESEHVYGEVIYVATNGDDVSGDGSITKPYASIEKAQQVIRDMASLPDGGVLVYFRGGVYNIYEGIEFGAEDSGTKQSPIKYMAYPNETVEFHGSIDIMGTEMEKVSDPDVLATIPSSARDKAYEVYLGDVIDNFKPLQFVGHSVGNLTWLSDPEEIAKGKNKNDAYYSVSMNGEAMTLSRWPNVGERVYHDDYLGFTRINTVIDKGAYPRFWKDDVNASPLWVAPEDRDQRDVPVFKSTALTTRMESWVGIPLDGSMIQEDGTVTNPSVNPWMMGFWGAAYSDQSIPIQSLKTDGTITADEPSGYSISTGATWARFYVYNLIQEMDLPGEWYIDQGTYMLYLIPVDDADMNSDETLIQVASLEDTMFTFDNTNYITIDGINMSSMLESAVNIIDSDYINIRNADIKETQKRAGYIGGTSNNSGFSYCDFENVNGGIGLNGGDLKTLEKANNYVEGGSITNFATMNKTYNPAIDLGGVGNRMTGIEISDGPHAAIIYKGNDHIVEFSEIYDVVKEAADQGAIYTNANVSQRGTVIRNNYFHDIVASGQGGADNYGIYMDGHTGGCDVIDNIFEDVTNGIQIGGARNMNIIGNTFINVESGAEVASNCYIGIFKGYWSGYGMFYDLFDKNKELAYDIYTPEEPYNKYPNFYSQYYDDFMENKYNKVIDNVGMNVEEGIVGYMLRSWRPDEVASGEDNTFEKGNSITNIDKFSVSATSSGNGSVNSVRDRDEGGITRLVATADKGFMFESWTENGAIVSTNPDYFFMATADRNLVANFKAIENLDKLSLQDKITEALTKLADNSYTQESKAVLSQAVKNAQNTMNTEKPTNDMINSDISAVEMAIQGLEEVTIVTDSIIVVEEENSVAGETVEVSITLENNPGISAMKLTVNYDETALKLVGITYGDEFTGAYQHTPADLGSPVNLNWVSLSEVTTNDVIFANLKFEVLDTATEGVYDITVTYDPENVHDELAQNVTFDIDNGSVEVMDYVLGDVNGDGMINNKDVFRLLNYVSDSSTVILIYAADLNDDGRIDNADVLALFSMVSTTI